MAIILSNDFTSFLLEVRQLFKNIIFFTNYLPEPQAFPRKKHIGLYARTRPYTEFLPLGILGIEKISIVAQAHFVKNSIEILVILYIDFCP